MTEGPLLLPLISYSLPIILTGILQLLFNATDLIVVGQFVNDTAVGAIGSTTQLITLSINLFIGISLGSTVTIASHLGAKSNRECSAAAHTALALGVIFGIFVGILGSIFAKTLLTLMHTPAEFLSQATLYMRIYFLGTPAFMIYTFGRSVIVAKGDTRKPLYYLFLSGAINVVLDLALVIFFHMGVAGVAIATVTSQFVSAFLMTSALTHLDGPCHITLSSIRINKTEFKRIIRLGLPAGIQNTLFSLSNVVIQSSINMLGAPFVKGNAAAANIEGFIYTSMNSFTQGCMSFAGRNHGAGKINRLNRLYACTLLCVVTLGLSLGSIAYFTGANLLRIYLPDASPKIITYGMIRLSILVVFDFLCGMMDCSSGMLRGIKHSFFPMIATIVGSCLLRIIWGKTVFAHFFETSSHPFSYRILLSSYPISWGLTFLTLFIYYVCVRKSMDRDRLKSRRLS